MEYRGVGQRAQELRRGRHGVSESTTRRRLRPDDARQVPGNELNGVYSRSTSGRSGAQSAPELTLFDKYMNAIHKPINEQAARRVDQRRPALQGDQAGRAELHQKSVIDADQHQDQRLPRPNGLRPPIDWSFDGPVRPEPTGTSPNVDHETCTAYELFDNGKFVPQFGKPGQPFECSTENPLPRCWTPRRSTTGPPKPGQVLPTDRHGCRPRLPAVP